MKGLILFEGTTTVVKNNYYNVTEVLKLYPNKRASRWFNSDRTKEYVKALNDSNVQYCTLELFKTSKGSNPVTIIHKSLIIDFARWIDPKFAIACDNFIYDNIEKSELRINELEDKTDTQQRQLDYFWDKEDQRDLYPKY